MSAPWVAGAAWTLAHLLNTKQLYDTQHPPDLLHKPSTTGGNIMEPLGSDRVAIAKFFAVFPKAADHIQHWVDFPNSLALLGVSAIVL